MSQSERDKQREDSWLSQMSFRDPVFESADGREFVIKKTFGNVQAPMLSTLRPVVDQVKNRLYAFDPNGEGFLMKDYGTSHMGANEAVRAAEYFWGKPSQETWGHVNRPVPASYDNDTFALMEEFGADILDKMNMVRCARACCKRPVETRFDHWRLSNLEPARILARAAISMSNGELIQLPDEHVVYVAPAELNGDAIEYDRFIKMVQMFGEPFDAVNGQPNPIYINVLEQYRDGS